MIAKRLTGIREIQIVAIRITRYCEELIPIGLNFQRIPRL